MMTRPTMFALGLLSLAAACQPSTTPAPRGAAAAPAAAAPAPKPSNPRPELGSFGIDLSARKSSVSPGDDFYDYANGSWLESYQLKPDEMRYGPFVKLQYRSEDQVKAILDELEQVGPAPGSLERQIVDYFQSFMDVETLNAKGIEPLRHELETIRAIANRDQLIVAFGRSGLAGTAAPIQSFVDIDRKDPSQHRLNVMHSGLGLPSRDFYLEASFAETRAAYRANIATLLGFAGTTPRDAEQAAQRVLALETEIATHHWPLSDQRQMEKTHNPSSLEKLEKDVPGYAWRRHLDSAGIDPEKLEKLNVATPSALAPLARVITQTPLSTWKHYLSYHLINNHAELLGDAIDNAAFSFHGKVLNGQPEQRERWKRGIMLVGSHQSLGEAVGRLYVERHFPPTSKQMMDELVENLRAAFADRLAKLDWMGEQTKREAFSKLKSFNPKIGYPKKWRDFSSIQIKRGDLVGNYRAVHEYWYRDELGRLDRPTDKDEWYMSPHQVNAYYNPAFNEIVFPAAILQPPFFDPHADAAVNYGGIGAVIGHEMGHGFDDQGSRSDHAGVQRNWWSDRDRDNFEARTRVLVEQYASYEPLKGHRVNGELTLGENIGDLGGLSLAYHAYQKSLAGEQPPVIEGFTGSQRFFLSWAQVWRMKQRDEFLLRVLKSDPHSPARYRVNGVVRNMDEWYAAFDVEPGGKLFLAPPDRVSIW